jgi:hypothetical protein
VPLCAYFLTSVVTTFNELQRCQVLTQGQIRDHFYTVLNEIFRADTEDTHYRTPLIGGP